MTGKVCISKAFSLFNGQIRLLISYIFADIINIDLALKCNSNGVTLKKIKAGIFLIPLFLR